MGDKELMKMVTILMEMPKESYFRCKQDILKDELYKSHESTEWLSQLFALIEKHRPGLAEEKGGAV